MIQRPPTLGDAVQHLAVRKERDERWARRVILREQWRRLLCRACAAAVEILRKIGL